MNPRNATVAGALALAALLAGCSSALQPTATGSAAPSPATSSPAASASATVSTAQADRAAESTVVRFRSDATSVDVTIGEDTPATRDFLSMLPLTISLEEFSGREKIGYLPRELNHQGSPGSDPEDGDLIYFVPWGNLGFYYDTTGVGYSDQTLHLGRYNASLDQLNALQGDDVTVEVVR